MNEESVPAGPLRSDGHLHIGDLDRLEELGNYVAMLQLHQVVLLSLPTVGVDARGAECINFNPEVLAGCALLGGRARGFGSLDNRALPGRAAGERTPAGWDPQRQLSQLRDAGFAGLKLWEGKPELQSRLGVRLDHPEIVGTCRLAGEWRMPVLVHVADPPEFWYPGGVYSGRNVASFAELQRQAEALCGGAPQTAIIFAHMLFLAARLELLAAFLERHPNAMIDLAPGNYQYTALAPARHVGAPDAPEQYRASQAFFRRYRSRIIAGSDAFFLPLDFEAVPGMPLEHNLERYLRLERFLSTTDAIVSPYPQAADRPLCIGLGLDRETCALILGGNLERLLRDTPQRAESDPLRWLERWCGSADGEDAVRRGARAQQVISAVKV